MLLIIIGLCLSVALFDQDFFFFLFFKQLPKTLNTLAVLLTKTSEGYKCPLLFAAEKFCRPTVV